MSQKKQTPRFEAHESGFHRYAVRELSSWVNGVREEHFRINGLTVFVPDVTCYKNGVLDSVYEVVHSHPLTGKKLGLIDYWCYRNSTELTVFEVSADFILKQTEKPERIETMECYVINPFENE